MSNEPKARTSNYITTLLHYIFWDYGAVSYGQWGFIGQKTWVKRLKESDFRPSALDFRRTMSSKLKNITLLHYIFWDDGLWDNETTSQWDNELLVDSKEYYNSVDPMWRIFCLVGVFVVWILRNNGTTNNWLWAVNSRLKAQITLLHTFFETTDYG